MGILHNVWTNLLRGAVVPAVVGQAMETQAVVAPAIPAIRRPEFLARAWSPQEFYAMWNGIFTDALYHGRMFLLAGERGNGEVQEQAAQHLNQSASNAAAIFGAYFGRESQERYQQIFQAWNRGGMDYMRASVGGDEEGRKTASQGLVEAKDQMGGALGETFGGLDWVQNTYPMHLQGTMDHTRWAIDARRRKDWREDMMQVGHLISNKESLVTVLTYHFSKKFNPQGEAIPSDLAAFNLGAWATTMAIQGNAGLLMMKEGGAPAGLGIAETETSLALLWGNTMWNSRLVGLAIEEEDEAALRELLQVREEIRQQWRAFLGPFCDRNDLEAYHGVSEETDQRWLELVRESRRDPANIAEHTYTNRMVALQGPLVESTVNLYKRWMTPRSMLTQAIEPAVSLLLMAQGMAIDVRSALVREPGSMPPRRIAAPGMG